MRKRRSEEFRTIERSNSGILNELKIDTYSPWRVSADLSESRKPLTLIFLMKSRQHLHLYRKVSGV